MVDGGMQEPVLVRPAYGCACLVTECCSDALLSALVRALGKWLFRAEYLLDTEFTDLTAAAAAAAAAASASAASASAAAAAEAAAEAEEMYALLKAAQQGTYESQ
jgi:hypothetical protein